MEVSLRECINYLGNVSDDTFGKLELLFSREEYPAKTILVHSGEVSDKLYFMAKGCMSSIYKHKEQLVTLWFGVEKDAIGCFKSLITGKAGNETLVLQERSVVYVCDFNEFSNLKESNLDIQNIYVKIMEMSYLYWENRIMELQFNTSKERYVAIIKRTPEILQRFPLGQIASYIGVTQETLSRIRSQKN